MIPLTQSPDARGSKHQLRAFCGAALIVVIFLTGTSGRYHSFGSDRRKNRSAMVEERMNTHVPVSFYDVLRKTLKKRRVNIESICPGSDSVARRVLEDYGAI